MKRALDGLIITTALITACSSVAVAPPPDASSSGTTSTSNGGAGGGTSTAGTGGTPGVCVPGSTIACYDGPPGTAGVGVCTGGVQTCDPDGNGYGPCLGQTLPQQDLCTTADDEDCSGSPTPCTEVPPWGLQFGTQGDSCSFQDACIDKQGDVILVISNGSYPVLGADISATALAKLDPFGKVIFAANLYSDVAPLRVAAEPGGTVLLASSVDKTLFIDRYDDQGNITHFAKLPSTVGAAAALTADAAGNVFFAGTFTGSLDFGDGPLFPSESGVDLFVAKLSADGKLLWARRAGAGAPAPGNIWAYSLAIDGAQDLVMTGAFANHLDFGAGALNSAGSGDVFVAKFDSAGNPLFTKRFGDAGNQSEAKGVVDPAGNIFLLGYYEGTLDFGGGPLSLAPPSGALFLAKLDPAGNHVFSKGFAYSGGSTWDAIAAGPGGSVFAAGSFGSTFDPGGGPLASAGSNDIYLARFDSLGALIAAKRYGDESSQGARSVQVDPAGVPILLGEFAGTVDFGAGPLSAVGLKDIFIERNAFP
jgi:hypothetical protein